MKIQQSSYQALVETMNCVREARIAVAGNSWQNVFPTHIRDYQDWWARVQAA